MTRLLRDTNRQALRLVRLGLTAYFVIFLAWILPNHALSHERANITDRVSCSPSADSDHVAHNPDRCQICRTHGQLDAWPTHASTLVWEADTAVFPTVQNQPAPTTPAGQLSPRAPPQFA